LQCGCVCALQFSWLVALLFMAYVKYEHHWRITLLTGAIALLLMALAWLRVRALWSNHYHDLPPRCPWVDALFAPLERPWDLVTLLRLVLVVLVVAGVATGAALVIALL
jgi:hypothetical protein